MNQNAVLIFEDYHLPFLAQYNMESQNIMLPPSLRSEDINEIKNSFIVFAGSEDGIYVGKCYDK